MNTWRTKSPEETREVGKSFAAQLKGGDVVTLAGNLGSGKTQFVVGVCEGLNVRGHVASPTFTFINEYETDFGKVAHMDLYRISKRAEIAELGVGEYFNENCVCLIEWPDMIVNLLPEKHYEVRLSYGEQDNERQIEISGPVAA